MEISGPGSRANVLYTAFVLLAASKTKNIFNIIIRTTCLEPTIYYELELKTKKLASFLS